MSHSVRRALVDWLQRIVDHLSEKLVEDLGRPEVHPKPGHDVNNGLVVGVYHPGPKGQVYVPVPMPGLGDVVREHGGSLAVSECPPLIGNRYSPLGLHGNVVNHQQGSSLNLKNMTTLQQTPSLNKDVERFKRLQGAVIGNLSRKESSGGDK